MYIENLYMWAPMIKKILKIHWMEELYSTTTTVLCLKF